MTKQMTKKATQQRVTTGTFLKVANVMGVGECGGGEGEDIRVGEA
jgi:hypothetical protein